MTLNNLPPATVHTLPVEELIRSNKQLMFLALVTVALYNLLLVAKS